MINYNSESQGTTIFNLIFSPATSLMARLNFTRKSAVLALIIILGFSMMAGNLYVRHREMNETTKQELVGLSLLSPLFNAVQIMQQHRGLSVGVLAGASGLKEAHLAKQEQSIEAFDKLQKKLPSNITNRIPWQEIKSDWKSLIDQGMAWSAEDNFTKYSKLISRLLNLGITINDEYALTYNTDIHTYLLNTTLHQLTLTQEYLGQIRGLGTGILTKNYSTELQKIQINTLVSQADTSIQSLIVNLEKIGRYNPTIQQVLPASSQDISTSSQYIFTLVKSDIISGNYINAPEDFYRMATEAIDSTYELLDRVLLPATETLIKKRYADQETSFNIMALIVFLIYFFLFYFSVGVYIAVSNNIQSISRAVLNVANGDFSKRLQFESNSEFESLGNSFNYMSNELKRMIDKEKEDAARTHGIIDSAFDALVQMNDIGEIIGWSDQAERNFGWTHAEVIGQKLHETIIPQRYRDAHTKGLRSFMATGKVSIINKVVEFEALHHDGHEFPVEITITPTKVIGGYEFNAFIRDISLRKQGEKYLKRLARVFIDSHDGISITDTDGTIIDVNPAFCRITGYRREEIIGKNPSILNSGKQDREFYAEMWQTLDKEGNWQGEVWNRKKNGEVYAEHLSISSLKDEHGHVTHYVGTFADITENLEQQKKLDMMANYDVLTQLPNRALLVDRFAQAIAHCKRSETDLAVCFLDIDNFQPVNDNLGHDVGDQLLIKVAERIKENIREEDTISRHGGDEFVVLLGNVHTTSQCEQLLERIVYSISQPFLIDEHTINISASLGVTLYPNDDADIDTLIRHADQAMYQVKLAGKNNYLMFNAEEDKLIIQKQNKLQVVQDALLHDEFCLYYQPKINLRTGEVFGAEALLRWQHPEKGIIQPSEFLPIIEGTQLEIQVGDWVINEALKQLDIWKALGLELEVSVNISSFHLLSSSLLTKLEKALERHPDVDSKYFQLEILESSALGDVISISNIIIHCRDILGIDTALDDFGTGYSSLTHLRNLPTKTIKIDTSFVRDMLIDPNDYAIIDGILGLADSFNQTVIAEGVETIEHGLVLLLMGCENAQGYVIARPMPASDIPAWRNNYTHNEEWKMCGLENLTEKERKIKLYWLAVSQWKKHLESNIHSLPGSIQDWPILERNKGHSEYWMKRSRQEQLLAEDCLDKLKQIHDEMHTLAHGLKTQYQEGDHENAREGLKDLQSPFDRFSKITDINKLLVHAIKSK